MGDVTDGTGTFVVGDANGNHRLGIYNGVNPHTRINGGGAGGNELVIYADTSRDTTALGGNLYGGITLVSETTSAPVVIGEGGGSYTNTITMQQGETHIETNTNFIVDAQSYVTINSYGSGGIVIENMDERSQIALQNNAITLTAPNIVQPSGSTITPLAINSIGALVSGSMSPWVLANVTFSGLDFEYFHNLLYFRYNTERLEFKGLLSFGTNYNEYFSSFRITNVPSPFYSSNLMGHSFFIFQNNNQYSSQFAQYGVGNNTVTNALEFRDNNSDYTGEWELSFEQISIKI